MKCGRGLTSKQTGSPRGETRELNKLLKRVYCRLLYLASKRGVPVYCHELKDAYGKIYYFSKENCFIVLDDKNTLYQNAFVLGHELGHYMQYKHKYQGAIAGLLSQKKSNFLEDDSMEADADRFAGKLLVYVARQMIKERVAI